MVISWSDVTVASGLKGMLLETCLLSDAGAGEAVIVVLIFVLCGGCALAKTAKHKKVRAVDIRFMILIWMYVLIKSALI
jgi:hypothetical protein